MKTVKKESKSRLLSYITGLDLPVYIIAAVFFGLFYLADTPYEDGFFVYMVCQAIICMAITAAVMLKMPQRYDSVIIKTVYCWSCFVVIYVTVKLINNIVRYFDTGKFNNPLHFRTLLSMMGVCVWVLIALLIVRMFSKTGDSQQSQDSKVRFIRAFRNVEWVFITACFITLIDGFVFIRSIDLFGARELRIVPFGTIINLWNSGLSFFQLFCQYAGNLLLFFPFGFAAKSRNLDKSDKKSKRIMFYLSPVALTLAIELSQLILNTGCCDIDDVILNIAGYYIGVVVVMLCNKLRAIITKGQEQDMFIA